MTKTELYRRVLELEAAQQKLLLKHAEEVGLLLNTLNKSLNCLSAQIRMQKIAYDSSQFCWCDLCGQVIVGGTSTVVESNGKVTEIADLQISHRQCWEDTFGRQKE